MAKIRVYELAKELGKDNKMMENIIRGLGFEIKGVMSLLDEEIAEAVRRHLWRAPTPPQPQPGPTVRLSPNRPPQPPPGPHVPIRPPTAGPPWDALLQRASSPNPHERRTAVLDACEELKRTLANMGISGGSMLDALLEIPDHFELTARELAQAIRANHSRNKVAHDKDTPGVDETEAIVRAFSAVASKARVGAPGR